MFIGVKLIGDTYVPAGEESTRVNTTDGTVRSFNLGVLLHSATITITIKQNFYTTDGMVRTSLWGFALFATITIIKQKVAKQKELLHNGRHGGDTKDWIGLWVNFVKPLRVSNCAN